jgi:hypothetical protein
LFFVSIFVRFNYLILIELLLPTNFISKNNPTNLNLNLIIKELTYIYIISSIVEKSICCIGL